jgi:hypothetical protein
MSKQTRAYVIAAHESHFFAFRNTQRDAAPFLIHVKTLADLRMAGNSQVLCVGPFWTHPHWEELLQYMRKQTIVNPAVTVQWFPM